MANSKKQCKQCKCYFPAADMIKVPAGTFCTVKHAIEFANKEKTKQEKADLEWKKDLKRRVDSGEFEKNSRSHYIEIFQDVLNQWIVHVRDKDEPCCTCGETSPYIKYDAGHYRSRGACKELSFELTNIHKQCSISCNVNGSGMRHEYREFITNKYGSKHLEWLDGKHPLLKTQYPTISSLKKAAAKYRKLLKEAGLKAKR